MEDLNEAKGIVAQVEQLARTMARRGLTHLEIQSETSNIQLKRSAEATALHEVMPPLFMSDYQMPTSAAMEEAEEESIWQPPQAIEICSTLVGYFQPAPIEPGTRIERGQTVAQVEVLGIPNEIPSTITGILLEWAIQAGEAVQYGQPIALIEPLMEEET
jgi:biotin carboxyl carrier protein